MQIGPQYISPVVLYSLSLESEATSPGGGGDQDNEWFLPLTDKF